MKKYFTFSGIFLCITVQLFSQPSGKLNKRLPSPQKTITCNIFGIAEPQAAIGIGLDNIITQRSGYFTEMSYIFKAPFYKAPDDITGGYRFIAQYRYYLKWNKNWHYFLGPEFRIKQYGFKGIIPTININTGSYKNLPYRANAFSIGGAFLAGLSFPLSKNKKWQGEMTLGIGAKQKFVKFKNIPEEYKINTETRHDGLRPPAVYEAVGMPYFPIAIRLKYLLN